jgi:hypothetical protein
VWGRFSGNRPLAFLAIGPRAPCTFGLVIDGTAPDLDPADAQARRALSRKEAGETRPIKKEDVSKALGEVSFLEKGRQASSGKR